MDPADYLEGTPKTWRTPVVVYRATSKYTEEELRDWVGSQDTSRRMAVFVGAPSRERRVATGASIRSRSPSRSRSAAR
jgi:hypothetical protein